MNPQRESANPEIPNRAFRHVIRLVVIFFLLSGGMEAMAQAPPADDIAMRNRAFLLCQQSNFAAALPILEKLAEAHPTDVLILERLGSALAFTAPDSPDPAVRKQIRLRARSIFLRAKELGDNSDFLATNLEELPVDGEGNSYSAQKGVNEAMREGEAAFGKSDFPAAIAAYQRALQLDPKTYLAAVFTGDVYYDMNQMDRAGEWFAKAIAINPDRETAYRFWGDALLKEGKMEEAKTKYIEAVVCQPYQRASWNGLHHWVKANHATISDPELGLPKSVDGVGDHINLTILPDAMGKDRAGDAWMAYLITRAKWRDCEFKTRFPNEKTYRHSLAEETDALNAVAGKLSDKYQNPRKRKKLLPSLLILMELHERGMIEPFVLLSKSDDGIVQDYVAYRTEHRDKLRQYISEWLIKPDSAAK